MSIIRLFHGPSFRQKAPRIMTGILAIARSYYAERVVHVSATPDGTAPPLLGLVMASVIFYRTGG